MDKKVIKRYSEAFKREVVREYEEGASAARLREKYGREGSRYKLMVIQKPEEQDQVKALKHRITGLQKALAQVTLDKLMLESTVEVLEEELGERRKKQRVAIINQAYEKQEAAGMSIPLGQLCGWYGISSQEVT